MKFKGTKGPWVVDNLSYRAGITSYLPIKSSIDLNRSWIVEAKGSHVNDGITPEEMEANAQLISKAPEMLEMLEKIENDLRHGYHIQSWVQIKIATLIKEATEL